MGQSPLDEGTLAKFEKEYCVSHTERAIGEQHEFLKRFPKEVLGALTLGEYVVGRNKPTFCAYVGSRTNTWASTRAGFPSKFGIYFGSEGSDQTKEYRFADKYGRTEKEAFEAVKTALLDLIRKGGEKTPDFIALDSNLMSQTVKAKLLSLYFSETFLAVCSEGHLKRLASIFGFAQGQPLSQYQHLLLRAKHDYGLTSTWSNPKFMAFLYQTYGTILGFKGRLLS